MSKRATKRNRDEFVTLSALREAQNIFSRFCSHQLQLLNDIYLPVNSFYNQIFQNNFTLYAIFVNLIPQCPVAAYSKYAICKSRKVQTDIAQIEKYIKRIKVLNLKQKCCIIQR